MKLFELYTPTVARVTNFVKDDEQTIALAVDYLRDNSIDWGGGDGEEVLIQYSYDRDLDDDIDKIDIESEDFKDWLLLAGFDAIEVAKAEDK